MESAGGVSAFAKMTPAQLAAIGFAKGTTGAEAVASVKSSLIGGMFGGGHTGAAIMQLMNEQTTYMGKLSAITTGQQPKTYAAALALAFHEPIVVFHKLEAQVDNLAIEIGKDVTPALTAFGEGLLSVGSWFGKNKLALEAVGSLAGLVVGAAAIVKTISVGEKVASSVGNVFKALVTGTSASATGPLDVAAGKLTVAGSSLQLAADRLMGAGEGGLGAGAVGTGVTDAEEAAGGGALLGGKSLYTFAKGTFGKAALGAALLYGYNALAEPELKKYLTAQEDRTANDIAHGAIIGGTIASVIPGVGTLFGAGVGAGVGAIASVLHGDRLSPQEQLAAARTQVADVQRQMALYTSGGMGLGGRPSKAALMSSVAYRTLTQQLAAAEAAQGHLVSSGMGVSSATASAFVEAMSAAAKQKGTSAQDSAASRSVVQLVVAGVKAQNASGLAQIAKAATSEVAAANKLLNLKMTAATKSEVTSSAVTDRVAGVAGVSSATASTFLAALQHAAGLKTSSAQDSAAANAAAQLVAAGVKQKDAADHYDMSADQITAAAKTESEAVAKLLSSANESDSASNAANNSSEHLNSAANSLEAAAVKLLQASSNAASAFAPGNIHALAVAGTKQKIART